MNRDRASCFHLRGKLWYPMAVWLPYRFLANAADRKVSGAREKNLSPGHELAALRLLWHGLSYASIEIVSLYSGPVPRNGTSTIYSFCLGR